MPSSDPPNQTRHPVNLRRLLVLIILLILGTSFFGQRPQKSIQVAVAKGGRLFDTADALDMAANQALARDIVLSNGEIADTFAGTDLGFLYATPLTNFQKRQWEANGCRQDVCAQATFYDYDRGGTVEAVVNLTNGELIGYWRDLESRPGASPNIVPRALSIAATNSLVQDTLGNVRASAPLMVPMSAWLTDDDCRVDWCVDLTYMAPDDSGRILHVLVNMEKEEVARLFYTRGRSDRLYKQPAAQGARFNNGCHEQYGWNVCWEMTANDGIEFFDANFQGKLIFSSAKIGQVEVYYPSWPGGYRDEIGYAASVHPYYGTNVNDLDGTFEVRQLFTEFLRWPNCICCYRYEQIMRFFSDGTFEAQFISHGPGCDDLSSYRPFWRIDVDIGDSINDEVWYWDGSTWQLADLEIFLPLFSGTSPEGYILFTAAGDLAYLWSPLRTDPLGLDDGRLYVLRYGERQGEGVIQTGPADTFWPPGQWLSEEPLSKNNIVIWYIPILKTKQGGPWWCMPDPEPDFSPCDAILQVEPAQGLPESPTPTATSRQPETETPRPTATTTPAPTSTPWPIAGNDPETIILNSGCGSCHVIGNLGEVGKVGPDLSNIGFKAGNRVPGLGAAEYIRQSILEPGAFISPDCPNGSCQDNIMPADYSSRLTPTQIEILVSYLLEQRTGAPTPTITLSPADTPSSVSPTREALDTPTAVPLSPDHAEGISSTSILIVFVLAAGIFLLLILFSSARSRSP